jgi:hypothetical protein
MNLYEEIEAKQAELVTLLSIPIGQNTTSVNDQIVRLMAELVSLMLNTAYHPL